MSELALLIFLQVGYDRWIYLMEKHQLFYSNVAFSRSAFCYGVLFAVECAPSDLFVTRH